MKATQELPGKTYSPEKLTIKSDRGTLIQYSLEPWGVDEGFGIFLRLLPVVGSLLSGLGLLKAVRDDGPLMQLIEPWVRAGGAEGLATAGINAKLPAIDPELGPAPGADPDTASLLDGQAFKMMQALGDIGGPQLAEVPTAFAAAVMRAGGSQLIKEMLATAHRYDRETGTGGRVGEQKNYDIFYRRNFGEALRACWAVFMFNFGPMFSLGK